jgi:hypothetical protein
MQLIEYFIWININNKSLNTFFTTLAFILINIQPIFSLMIINNHKLRKILLIIYIFFVVFNIFIIYNTKTKTKILSYPDKNHHLVWYSNINSLLYIGVYYLFLIIGLIIEKKWAIIIIGISSFLFVLIKYLNKNISNIMLLHNSFGSVWCWSVNLIMLYYLVYLLIYLPLTIHN